MRRLPLLAALLLLPALALAEEPPVRPPDPPGVLRPGAAAGYRQLPRGERFAGTTKYRVERGDEDGTVLLHHLFETGDLGPLSFRSHLTAVVDTAKKRFLSFTYRGRTGPGAELRLLARLEPHETRPGVLVHRRFRYTEKGEPKVTRKSIKTKDLWVPDPLEPFAVGLLDFETESPPALSIVNVQTGRLSTVSVSYTPLGEGEMDIPGESISCRIFLRRRGEERATVYFRKKDLMPVRHGPAGISYPEREEAPPGEEEGR